MKHTSSAWKLNILYSKVISNDELELEICTIGINENNDHFSYEQYKANAKLIAAAPELLETLQKIHAISHKIDAGDLVRLDEISALIGYECYNAIKRVTG